MSGRARKIDEKKLREISESENASESEARETSSFLRSFHEEQQKREKTTTTILNKDKVKETASDHSVKCNTFRKALQIKEL